MVNGDEQKRMQKAKLNFQKLPNNEDTLAEQIEEKVLQWNISFKTEMFGWMGAFFNRLFMTQEQMACFVLWVQFKTKLGKQMHEVDLNTWIASIGRQVTFCCAMLRIQQITKLHLPSWEMGISWEAFSFLVLSFISSSYDVFFAISEIKQIFFLKLSIVWAKTVHKVFSVKSQSF